MPPTSELTDQQLMDSRDLSFEPVSSSNARTLTTVQVEDYNQLGYIKPFRIFNSLEAEANRAYFDYLLAAMRVFDDGRNTYAINGYHTRCEGIYDIATHPAILDLVEDIIGPNIIAWGTHFFCKMPYDSKAVPWHQDASYWPFYQSRTVTVWLAIDDADEENSAMKVIPGTHRLGPLKWRNTTRDAVLDQEIERIEQFGQPVSIDLQSGEIELHADMIAHGSEPNRSGRRRCGLTIRYCPPEAQVFRLAWSQNAILCRGQDPTDHWTCHPRPAGNDLADRAKRGKPQAIGGN